MNRIVLPFLLTILYIPLEGEKVNPAWLDSRFHIPYYVASRDTIPPIEDRYGSELLLTPPNPFDLNDPEAIDKSIEFDPETGQYIISETIGGDFFRPPTVMTFEEYLEYDRKKQETDYFRQLSGVNTGDGSFSALDPMAKMDIKPNLLDRLFGGTTVDIRPQGNIDLTFGADFQRVENPILTQRQRTQGGFDFDMDIQLNVTGKIGEKLNLSTNYRTDATFDFDNQIKLDYNSDLFSEDEIIKKIEAGNVSLPLRGSLIQGVQSLFGIKTEMQFGHLRVTAIASQQQSQQENIQLEGGSQVQEFSVATDQYDENRHFFLTHFNRETFEQNLVNLPQIRSLFRIENIEIWITNDRNEVDNVRDIVALADLGETRRLVSPDLIEVNNSTNGLPDNEANDLYPRLLADPDIREIDQVVNTLTNEFGFQQSQDFERVSARKLKPTEYTFHPELGFISLNINVQPDQVVGVAFQYSFNGQTYKVGELANNAANTKVDTSLQVLFVKMLKSTTQRTDVTTWDLMMKNVYPTGAFNINPADFRLEITYEDPGQGRKRFLPSGPLEGRPLLRVFNLDKLNVQGDPFPDGVFDFVPGVTINTRTGRVMFPVLEPFGESLADSIRKYTEPGVDPEPFVEQFTYPELYDSTLFLAQEFPEKNRYAIRGEYKSNISSEISLGAFNIPPGSVRVTAGGQTLVEGRDYEIDYNIGRVKILNDAILNSGVPVNVSYEDNTLFGFQTKTMFGVRADYELDENFNIGATWLNLSERPFTQKVNLGDDPINNSIYGLDLNFNREAPFLTKLVDAIPGLSTKEKSQINVSAEGAWIRPGHSRAINQNREDKGGVVYIDDFEGSASSFDIRQPVVNWFLASVPQNDNANNNPFFPEASLINDIRSNVNRARLSWYTIDNGFRNEEDRQNPYTSIVPQVEVFPNAQVPPNQLPNIPTLDLTYTPTERGPYNFDIPGGYPSLSQGSFFVGDSLVLNRPETRWGGIMRALQTNDFQSANIEFIEFWMLSPFLDPEDPTMPAPDWQQKEGDFYLNLGNVSEDILRDSRKFFENGLPTPSNPERRVDTTNWSAIPVGQQITRAFDNEPGTRVVQDLGLDGFNNEAEARQFSDYLDALAQTNPIGADRVREDPSADDFRYYGDFPAESSILERYRLFNNPQGNSQENEGSNQVTSATNIPDAEDLDQDNTLNETEAYFQYHIPILANPQDPREIDQNRTPFITDRLEDPASNRVWYRFRVPLSDPSRTSVGGIRDFRSIRFMRMYMRGFETQVTLRFARLELVRNQWRRYSQDLSETTQCEDPPVFDVDAVNIEENSDRQPFNYVLPLGIQREQSVGVFNNLQNEQSLTLKTQFLCDGEERAVFKTLNQDYRVYKRLKMFVHAEAINEQEIEDGELSVFVRLGSDFQDNYYEYEIPLVLSDGDRLTGGPQSDSYKMEVWREENEFDFALKILRDIKLQRNGEDFPLAEEYSVEIPVDHSPFSQFAKVKGNPNLAYVKVVMMGVRNRANGDVRQLNSEVWLNELRLTGLDERGGAAAIGRVDMQLADFGNLTLAGNYSSIGFGALDQKVQERARERTTGYDIAFNANLDKFLPETWGLQVPFYAQWSNTTSRPEFDPYDEDIPLNEKLDAAPNAEERDSIQDQAQDVTNIRSFNFTNVRKERTGSSKPMPWDVSNFSVSYANTKSTQSDPLIEKDEEKSWTASLDYGYSPQAKPIEPFKNVKGNWLQLIKEININPIPNNFTFSTQMNRRFATTRYRFTGSPEFSTFFNKSFLWDRNYNLQWTLFRGLNMNFNATNLAVIDEINEEELINQDFTLDEIADIRRDTIWNNILDWGRTKNYRQNLTLNYTLPLRFIPLLDWIDVKGQYIGDYSWSAAALNNQSLGNLIQNGQNIQINADFNLESLYNKSSYLASINGGSSSGGRRRLPTGNTGQRNNQNNTNSASRAPSTIEKILIRPLMMVRRARFTWSERHATVIPGFTLQSRLLGMGPGLEGPGLDFIFGLQPEIRTLQRAEYGTEADWLNEIANKGWLSRDTLQNQQVAQNYTQSYDGRTTIEPFRDFRLDLDLSRSYTENHTEYFKVLELGGDFEHTVPRQLGSMTVTYSALSTLFRDSNDDIIQLFNTFENNRVTISQRIGTGQHADSTEAALGYTEGYGRAQQDVLIPAFIAAYTDESPNSVKLDIFDQTPRINWRLTYNGLARVPMFQGLFQNFSITHGYKSTLTVNSFGTGLDYLGNVDFNDPNDRPVNEINNNFYPILEIPDVVIQEGFQPLIGLDMTFQNGISLNSTYTKQRTLAMSFVSNQLSETQTEQFDIGFGYLIRDVNIGFLTGSKSSKKDEDEDGVIRQDQTRTPQARGRDLDINFTFSLRDDVTFNHLLDQGVVEPTRGNYSLQISPSAEYRISQQLSLRLFFDYRRNVPRISSGFPRTDTAGGIVVRFALN